MGRIFATYQVTDDERGVLLSAVIFQDGDKFNCNLLDGEYDSDSEVIEELLAEGYAFL